MERITVNPRILGGKPIIEGTRISVEFILDLLASDVSEEEILQDYPHLSREAIHACLGIIFLRIRDLNPRNVVRVCTQLLDHDLDYSQRSLVVIEEARIRIRQVDRG